MGFSPHILTGHRTRRMPAKKTSKSPLSRAVEKNTYATPALEKGLDVIELLAHQPGG